MYTGGAVKCDVASSNKDVPAAPKEQVAGIFIETFIIDEAGFFELGPFFHRRKRHFENQTYKYLLVLDD